MECSRKEIVMQAHRLARDTVESKTFRQTFSECEAVLLARADILQSFTATSVSKMFSCLMRREYLVLSLSSSA